MKKNGERLQKRNFMQTSAAKARQRQQNELINDDKKLSKT
jgi:hypothetical protein